MKRISTIALATALVLAACSGDGEADDSAQPVEVTRSVAAAERGTTTTTTTVAPAETTTTAALAPSTLAFSSSDDVGRLFAVSGDITAVTTAGGDTASSEVSAGTIVQTSSLRSRDDVLWVRIERTDADGGTLGWAPASSLSPTSEAVLTENPAEARQFRQAASSVPNDFLGVFSSPGIGSPIVSIAEGSVAMHGGVTALAPSGEEWLDVIDSASGERIGWVEARFFRPVTSGVLQDPAGNTLERDPIDGLAYGQALSGGISATGCNAIQVRFTNASSSDGIGVVFGTESPIGRELSSGDFQWLGTSTFSDAGADIIITIPTSSPQAWFFAPLDADGQTTWTTRDENDRAVANDVLTIEAPALSCAFVPPSIVNDDSGNGPIDLNGTLTDDEIARLDVINGFGPTEDEEGAEGEEGTEGEETPADGEEVTAEPEAAAGEAPAEGEAAATDPVDPAAETPAE